MLFGINEKKVGKMVDIHCHILPGIDDGAKDFEESMEMLRIAASEGITEIVVTPHFKPEHRNAGIGTVNKLIRQLQSKIDEEGLNICLYPGNEILFYEEVVDLLDREDREELYTLNESKRVLVEFHPQIRFEYMRQSLEDIKLIGYVPILAHAERYYCLYRDRNRLGLLKDLGIEIQVNVGSAEGHMGGDVQRFTIDSLKDELVDYVSTDAHNTGARGPRYIKCYKKLAKILDKDYLERVFYYNALERIVIS